METHATARLGPIDRPPRIHIGDIRITLLDGGWVWLDGGAMFGIIPKPIWSKLVEVDDANRIPLAMTCFLVETPGKRILVESGAGHLSKYPEKERGFFNFGPHWIVDSLQAIGVERESIDYVILTHLHFDHFGGCTMPDGRGGFEVTFPRARHFVQAGEWEDAITNHAVMTGTYRLENLGPIGESGLMQRLQRDAEIAPGLRVAVLQGHTRHHQAVIFEDRGKRAVLPGDCIPTSAHVGLRYNMGYDLLPFENMVNKKQFLTDAVKGDWTLLLGQDPKRTVWRASAGQGEKFTLAPVP